jgi:hypothetical protein
VQAAKVHAALSRPAGAPDPAVPASAARQDTRTAPELLADLAEALKLSDLLEAEFQRGSDVSGPVWDALLALGGAGTVREWAVLRLKPPPSADGKNTLPATHHAVPLQVRKWQPASLLCSCAWAVSD